MLRITIFLAALLFSISVFADDVTISDDGSGIGTQTWTSDNVYILNGLCFVDSGQVLTIEAGTVIKAEDGQAENASALIVARGGKIYANGTADSPIIFTSVNDNLDGSYEITATGQWGGVIMLGYGQTNNSGESSIEGISSTEIRGLYGTDDENEIVDDESGSLTYVSIRHGGTKIGDGDEINGLTMGACGTETTVSYVEILANDDDGIEWFGGAPMMDHILVAYCADDSYDIDQGCRAYGQFLVTVQGENEIGECFGEHDGGSGDGETSTFSAHTIFSNCTYYGSTTTNSGKKKAFQLRDNWSGEYHNSIFSTSPDGAYIEYRDDKACSYNQLADSGNIVFANNIWDDVVDNTFASIAIIADAESEVLEDSERQGVWQSHLEENNTIADLELSETDLIPAFDSVKNPVYDDLPSWFKQVGYKGAFNPTIEDGHWAGGWTATFEGDTYNNSEILYVDGNEVEITDDGDGIGTQTWTTGNTYILNGLCFVNDGQVLTIEAGTVIKAQSGEAENASALIVARGGKIYANGTAENPIIFTTVNDELDGTYSLTASGQWGGVIMLGYGQTNNSSESSIEGISSTEERGLYGTDDANEVADDYSGYLKYVSIRHGGTKIGDGDEINGLTMGACGTETTVSYVEILANDDDGIEWFGGAPRMDHILVAYCADDSYDIDQGCRAYGQFFATIQGENEIGECFGEHDGGSGDGETSTFSAHTVFSNCTYYGSTTTTSGKKKAFQLRDNWSGEYHNSIFSTTPDGAYLEYRDDKACSYNQLADSGNIVFANNIWDDVVDNTFASIAIIADAESEVLEDSERQGVWQSYLEENNTIVDLDLSETNLIPTESLVGGAVFDDLDDWFTTVNYKGAFNPGIEGHWAGSWTATFENDTYNASTEWTSIDEISALKESISIYPNPMSESATVSFDNEGGSYTFSVYSITGSLIKEITDISTSEFQFSSKNLKSGVYLYKLSDNNISATGKLLVK